MNFSKGLYKQVKHVYKGIKGTIDPGSVLLKNGFVQHERGAGGGGGRGGGFRVGFSECGNRGVRGLGIGMDEGLLSA